MHARIAVADLSATADAANHAAIRREICFRSFVLCLIMIIFFPDSGILLIFCIGAIVALLLGIRFSREAEAYQQQLDAAAAAAAAERMERIRNRVVLVAEPAPPGAATAPGNRHNVVAGMPIRNGREQGNGDMGSNNAAKKMEEEEEKFDGDEVYGRAQYAAPAAYGSEATGGGAAAAMAQPDYVVVADGDNEGTASLTKAPSVTPPASPVEAAGKESDNGSQGTISHLSRPASPPSGLGERQRGRIQILEIRSNTSSGYSSRHASPMLPQREEMEVQVPVTEAQTKSVEPAKRDHGDV